MKMSLVQIGTQQMLCDSGEAEDNTLRFVQILSHLSLRYFGELEESQ